MMPEKIEIVIEAFSEKLSDLDEYEPCEKLQKLLKNFDASDFVEVVRIDLRKCWIDYSFSHLYIDEALGILLKSKAEIEKNFVLDVSVDLGEPHFMAALLFPLSTVISSSMENGPMGLLCDIEKFSRKSGIKITINSVINAGETSLKNRIFVLGQGYNEAVNG